MNRRAFLTKALSASALSLAPSFAFGSQDCGPAIMTPYGPMQTCTAGIKSASFQAVQAYQEQNEWCWAACISMVFSYYGHSVSQQSIVRQTWDGDVRNMPAQPDDILRDLNRSWTDSRGREFTTVADVLSTNAITAVRDLQAERPLIIGAMGHATVLTALTGVTNLRTGAWQISAARVRDPWPGNGGLRTLSPQEWLNIRFAARIQLES